MQSAAILPYTLFQWPNIPGPENKISPLTGSDSSVLKTLKKKPIFGQAVPRKSSQRVGFPM